jgi:hypothetical protein
MFTERTDCCREMYDVAGRFAVDHGVAQAILLNLMAGFASDFVTQLVKTENCDKKASLAVRICAS